MVTSLISPLRRLLAITFVVLTLPACGGESDRKTKAATPAPKMVVISAEMLRGRLQASGERPLLVDVREAHEFKAGHIEGARLAPLGNVEKHLESVPRNREIVLVCRSDRRSGIAYGQLAARGFTNLANMKGGMLAWQKLEYPVVKE